MGGRLAEGFDLPSGKMTIGDAHAYYVFACPETSSFGFHHARMREQNEDGGPYAASTAEIFATRRVTNK